MYLTKRQKNMFTVTILVNVLLAAIVFYLDASVHVSISVELFYIIGVLIALKSPVRHYAMTVSVISSFLILFGLVYFRGSESLEVESINRILALLVLWLITVISLRQRNEQEKYSKLNLVYNEINSDLQIIRDQFDISTTALEQKNQLLQELANKDGLTKIFNHRYFKEFLANEINRSMRHVKVFSLIIFDIDHFKTFNDTYGHQVGDFVLKHICKIAQSQIRTIDLIARYGGEEFVIVLPETHLNEARFVAEKVRQKIEETPLKDPETAKQYNVTISLGVSWFNPADNNMSQDIIIKEADTALYQAKENGRNQTVVFKKN
ncbi:MAG: GGDEF domain-containing protein [Calditrichaeota bacterium]|nr:GGDEF domain-containing protein [Calditrichota bacterium]